MFKVSKAVRQRRPLKVGLEGLSGSGKTFSALRLAFAMRRAGIGKRIVVADSENESAGLYDGVSIDGEVWQYDVCPIPTEMQNPAGYTQCYEYLVGQGYDIIIIDSMTHAWKGALNRVDELAAKSKDKFGVGWRAVTPEQETMMRTITDPRAHLITTTRVKSEYERVTGNNGREQLKKVGTKADQREGMEYEYDVVVRIEDNHDAIVEKVRGCTKMDGKRTNKPGPEFWQPLFDWWLSAPEQPTPVPQPATTPTLHALPPRPAREPGIEDGITDKTQAGIEAALRILKREWNAETVALAMRAVGHTLPDDISLAMLTEAEGLRLLDVLNARLKKVSEQGKGGAA